MPACLEIRIQRASVLENRAAVWQEKMDQVAVEAPLTLRVEGRAIAVVMRTPGHDRELAAGFLLTENVIRGASDVFEISFCPSLMASSSEGETCELGDSVDVLLANKSSFDPDKLTRHVFTSSSCGICSKTSLTTAILPEAVLPLPDRAVVAAAVVAALPELLRVAQPVFASTGGLHACAWWPWAALEKLDALPPPTFLFEDVGRHNAVDKLLGHALLARQSLAEGLLLLSGRVSFELVQKAHAARIPIIAAVGAPSSLAVEYAHAAGITLAGFIRTDRLNLYTHSSRLGREEVLS